MSKFHVGDKVICFNVNEGYWNGQCGVYVGQADTPLHIHDGKIVAMVDFLGNDKVWLYEDDLRKLTKLDKALK